MMAQSPLPTENLPLLAGWSMSLKRLGLSNGIRAEMLKHASTSTSVQQISALTPVQRATLVQERRRLLSDLETVANDIEDTVRVGKARADCADDWTQDLEDLRFGAAALKRVEKSVTDNFETDFSVAAIVDDLIERDADSQTDMLWHLLNGTEGSCGCSRTPAACRFGCRNRIARYCCQSLSPASGRSAAVVSCHRLGSADQGFIRCGFW